MISVNRFVIEMYQSKDEFMLRKYTEHAAALEMVLKRLFKAVGCIFPKETMFGLKMEWWNASRLKKNKTTDSLIDEI